MTKDFAALETIAASEIFSAEAQAAAEPVNLQPVILAGLQEMLHDNAQQIQEALSCAAVLFMLQQDNLLLPVACSLDMPTTHYPAALQIGSNHATVEDDQGAAIKLQKFSLRHSLVARVMQASGNGQTKALCLTSDSLYKALRPLLSKSEANQLQRRLNIQEIAVLSLNSNEAPAMGVMLVAFARPLTQTDFDYLDALSRQVSFSLSQRHHLDVMAVLERIVLTMQSRMDDETAVSQTIVDAVAHDLGYAGAMVATLEEGHALPVRAYSLDINQSLIQAFEKQAGQSLISDRSVVYLDDARYQDNLSVRAVQAYQTCSERYLLSDHLYDLLRPFVNKTLCDFIQRSLSIKQVAALPFFWGEQVVGNLFVVSRQTTFTDSELRILTSFGQQAAAGLRNARMYRRAEEQRQIAEMFSRMAFGATASIHKLRNQIGAVRTYLYLLESLSELPPEDLQDLLTDVSSMSSRLDQAADLLDSLHQPWRHIPNEPVNVNHCLLRALGEVFPLTPFKPIDAQIKTEADIVVSLALSSEMPMVETTVHMLAEAFRIIIKNGIEALEDRPVDKRKLYVNSQWVAGKGAVITIRDIGKGIKPINLTRIFDLGWSTKEGQGMGFGLFWARDYIQGLGGSIAVESTIEEGTTFRLTLPATIPWEQHTVKLDEAHG